MAKADNSLSGYHSQITVKVQNTVGQTFCLAISKNNLTLLREIIQPTKADKQFVKATKKYNF